VAVGAKEHALVGFGGVGREGLAPGHRHRKGLEGGIDVVEVQVELTAVIAAYRTAATCTLDQLPSDLPVAAGDGLAYAAPALEAESPFSRAIGMKLDLTVLWAGPHLPGSIAERRPTTLPERACSHEHMFPSLSDSECGVGSESQGR